MIVWDREGCLSGDDGTLTGAKLELARPPTHAACAAISGPP